MLYFAIAAYGLALLAANLLVFAFGPWISPINSFILIGLDLALRDWLHFRLRAYQMALLIAATAVLTYLLAPGASQIAIASASAFALAALVDWSVFAKLAQSRWMLRSNASNIAGAAVDSVAFPTIAFGVLMPDIIALQFAAKVAGGAAWSYILKPRKG